jgi:hypothetical protein
MGNEIVYCSVCGDRLSTSDFEKGKAITLLKKHFCKKCAESVVEESADPEHDPTVTPSRRKIRTQRMPLADKPKPTPSNRTPFLIAAVVGIVAVGLLLYVLFANKS